MSDLAKRIREFREIGTPTGTPPWELLDGIAAEVEALEKDLAIARASHLAMPEIVDRDQRQRARIEELEAALREIANREGRSPQACALVKIAHNALNTETTE